MRDTPLTICAPNYKPSTARHQTKPVEKPGGHEGRSGICKAPWTFKLLEAPQLSPYTKYCRLQPGGTSETRRQAYRSAHANEPERWATHPPCDHDPPVSARHERIRQRAGRRMLTTKALERTHARARTNSSGVKTLPHAPTSTTHVTEIRNTHRCHLYSRIAAA